MEALPIMMKQQTEEPTGQPRVTRLHHGKHEVYCPQCGCEVQMDAIRCESCAFDVSEVLSHRLTP